MVNKTIYANLSPTATVLQLKKSIKKSKGFAVHQMKLTFREQELEDDKTLREYHITTLTQLKLEVTTRVGNCMCAKCKWMREKLTVNVKTVTGQIVRLEVTPAVSIKMLKGLIQKSALGVPKQRQRLVIGDKELQDHAILDAYPLGDVESRGSGAEPIVQLMIKGEPPTLYERFVNMIRFGGAETG